MACRHMLLRLAAQGLLVILSVSSQLSGLGNFLSCCRQAPRVQGWVVPFSVQAALPARGSQRQRAETGNGILAFKLDLFQSLAQEQQQLNVSSAHASPAILQRYAGGGGAPEHNHKDGSKILR